MVSWEAITALSEGTALLAAAVSFGIAQGRMRQKVIDMRTAIDVNTEWRKEVEGRLNSGEVNFKVIDTKLDYIGKSIEDFKATLIRCFGDKGI